MTEQEEKGLQIVRDAIRQAGMFDEENILKVLQERVTSGHQDGHDIAAVIWILAKKIVSFQKGFEKINSKLSTRSSAAKSQKNTVGNYFARWANDLKKEVEKIINS